MRLLHLLKKRKVRERANRIESALRDAILLDVSPAHKEMVKSHKLDGENHLLKSFRDELEDKVGESIASFEKNNSIENAEALIEEVVKWKAIVQCRESHTAGGYYDEAEKYMEGQWDSIIYPMIQDFDFTTTLEIAAGHGRNTEFLSRLSKRIIVTDVNRTCVEACEKRFGNSHNGCAFEYHVTEGNSLSFLQENQVTTVYSFDSMVHFDKLIVRDYVREIARVLVPGGKAFLHHSNLGAELPNSDWAENIGNRSDMTADLMREYAEDANLAVPFQRLSGISDGWGKEELDCFSVLQKHP